MPKIINSIRKHFGQHPNAIITDTNISDGAVRVFLYMCGKPDDWQFNNRDIQLRLNIKRAETMAKYWRELMESGWIIREPKLNSNGKPSGYFDYVLNFSPVKPTPQKPEVGTTNKPDTINQQLRINSSYTNTESITNINELPTHTNTIVELNGEGWVRIASENNLEFSTLEKNAIKEFGDDFLTIRSQKNKPVTKKIILMELRMLCQLKQDDYNIILLIEDSIRHAGGFLFKPTHLYKNRLNKSRIDDKPKNPFRPYQYENKRYIITETPEEKKSLAYDICKWYKEGLNPKTLFPLDERDKSVLAAHKRQFNSQQKTSQGFFVNYASWFEYVLQNEVATMKCLLDQDDILESSIDISNLSTYT